MVDTTVPPASNDEPEKKGVGLAGGAAALAAGGLAGAATGAALFKTAVKDWEKTVETTDITPQKAARVAERAAELAGVRDANFLKKGFKVAFNGGAKVTGIVIAAAAAATVLTGFAIKKIRNGGSHAERVEQERAVAAAAPATGPAVG